MKRESGRKKCFITFENKIKEQLGFMSSFVEGKINV